jgi:hypothetical protein
MIASDHPRTKSPAVQGFVHPTGTNANLPSVTGPTITIPASHSKIRRDGYLGNAHWRARPAETNHPIQHDNERTPESDHREM